MHATLIDTSNDKRFSARAGIQLERAMLCANCETIIDIIDLRPNGRCPHCESVAVATIAGWINRPQLSPRIIDTARR